MEKIISCLCLSVLFLSACNKNNLQPNTVAPVGLVCLTAKHHADTVENSEFYLKFNVDEFPGYDPAAYDTLYAEPPNDGTCCISGIAYGTYWFMSSAFDADWGQDVRGGLRLEVTPFQTKIDTVLVVNEY